MKTYHCRLKSLMDTSLHFKYRAFETLFAQIMWERNDFSYFYFNTFVHNIGQGVSFHHSIQFSFLYQVLLFLGIM